MIKYMWLKMIKHCRFKMVTNKNVSMYYLIILHYLITAGALLYITN